jgi:hypothetical protein
MTRRLRALSVCHQSSIVPRLYLSARHHYHQPELIPTTKTVLTTETILPMVRSLCEAVPLSRFRIPLPTNPSRPLVDARPPCPP